MSAPTQFRKKPVVISAIQWTGENLVDVIHFTDGRPPNNKSSHAGMMWDQYVDLVRKDGLKIFTMEGKMDASIGDWIIKGVKGEHYPCKPEIFALTYEDASAGTDLSQAAVAAAQMVADLDLFSRCGDVGVMDSDMAIDAKAMLTTLAAENATLRASEAAAMDRVTRLEAALQFYADTSGWNQPPVKTREGLFSIEYENQASKIQRDRGSVARQALTPTADKEPTT